MTEFNCLFDKTRAAFKQKRVFQRALELSVASLLALGKRTVSGMLAAGGKMNQDWSAAYRLFEKNRIKPKELFAPAIEAVLKSTDTHEPLYVMMDDTLIRKCGRKVSGAAWKRDPLGPAFHTNFVWGQRYLQISAALPDIEVDGRARGIPIDFHHAPSLNKPRKNAAPETWCEYKKQQKVWKVSAVGAKRLAEVCSQVSDRKVVCAVDGGFTNQEVFCSMPKNSVLIGRIRKDARLFSVPTDATSLSRGRKKYYGNPLPTPEQIRQDDSIPWQKVSAFAAGRRHEFEVKTIAPVRWKSSKNRDMLLLVIRPLAYRPRQGAKLLYRDPAYLICSDVLMPLDKIVQTYLWRWEIELNFRDEKTIIGVGEAQVRTPSAVQHVPAFIVASYSFLLLAAQSIKARSNILPSPKWYPKKTTDRCTTNTILAHFRSQYWGLDVVPNKTGFAPNLPVPQTHFYSLFSLASALRYAPK